MKYELGKHDRTYGFTLVELLVVISVILILISILLPALRKAKDMGSSVVCKNNLKQIYLNFHQYADDNDGCLPRYINPTWWVSLYWADCVSGFVKNKPEGILVCPVDPKPFNLRVYTDGLTASAGDFFNYPGSYGMNSYFFGKNYKLGQIKGGSEKMLMTDADYWRVRENVVNDFLGRYPYHGRKLYGLNQLYVDGHVDQYLTMGAPFYKD